MSGICIPGVPIIGNVISGGAGGGADLSDIDLTALTTDRRIDYSRAGNQSYWSADGTLQQAAENVWPLEYKNGVAVGRHEPEPQSTNLLKYARQFTAAELHNVTVINNTAPGLDGHQAAITANINTAGNGAYARHTGFAVLTGNWLTFSAFYRRTDTDVTLRNDIIDKVIANINLQSFALDGSVGDGWAGNYSIDERGEWARVMLSLQALADNAAVYADCMRLMRDITINTDVIVDYMQFELSPVATSPILSSGAATVRAMPFATVKNPGGAATAMRIHYTDNSHVDIDFPTDGTGIAIPPATLPWAKRYIAGIEYYKGYRT